MIRARDEELQINWACSAQNPDILPDSIRAASKKSDKTAKKAALKRHIQGLFPQ